MLSQESIAVLLPIGLNFRDGTGEGLVRIPDEHGRLILRSIGMNVVAMTEAVGVVKAHDRMPSVLISS